jgi:hypothetical protein
MKEYEARCLVEQWVRDYSPFKAEVVHFPSQCTDALEDVS